MEFISIRSNSVTTVTRHLTKKELNIIIETFFEYKNDRINFLSLLEALKDLNDIDEYTYNNMVRKYRHLPKNHKENQLLIILQAMNQFTFGKIVAIMRSIGYKEIAQTLIQKKFSGFIGHMKKSAVSNWEFSLSYYHKMKTYIDNHVLFDNTREGLELYIKRAEEIIHTQGKELEKRQRAADKIVPLYSLLVQQSRTREDRLAILDKMLKSVPRELDTTMVNVVYHSKRAITEGIAENPTEALEEAHTAEILCCNLETCFALIQSVHDHMYVYRQIYMCTYQPDDLKKILRLGDKVMDCVIEKDEEVQNQWKRVVLLFQALSLLQITSHFEVSDTGPRLTNDNIEKVDTILKEVRRILNKAEIRREMIYSICMARYKDLHGHLQAALTYQDEAVRLANQGGVFFPKEKVNIENYLEKLKVQFIEHRGAQGEKFGDTKPIS